MIEWIALVVSLFGVITTAWVTRWSTNKSIVNQNKQTYRPFLRIKSAKILRSFPKIFSDARMCLITSDEKGNACQKKYCFLKLRIENIGNGIANRIMIFVPANQTQKHSTKFYNQVIAQQEILSIDVKILYDYLENSSSYMIVFFEDMNENLYSTKFEVDVKFEKRKIKISCGQKETHDYQVEKKFIYSELKNCRDYNKWKRQRKKIKKLDGIIF